MGVGHLSDGVLTPDKRGFITLDLDPSGQRSVKAGSFDALEPWEKPITARTIAANDSALFVSMEGGTLPPAAVGRVTVKSPGRVLPGKVTVLTGC